MQQPHSFAKLHNAHTFTGGEFSFQVYYKTTRHHQSDDNDRTAFICLEILHTSQAAYLAPSLLPPAHHRQTTTMTQLRPVLYVSLTILKAEDIQYMAWGNEFGEGESRLDSEGKFTAERPCLLNCYGVHRY
jgi:hypothetical protein